MTLTATIDIAATPVPVVVDIARPGVAYPSQQATVLISGTAGPQGAPGSGTAVAPLAFPLTAASELLGLHRGTPPAPWLVDSTGLSVIGATYPDASHFYVSFPTPFTGTLYIP